jgi:hypothetical protein
MTLILAIRCADGLVLASDGQSTVGTPNPPMVPPRQPYRATMTTALERRTMVRGWPLGGVIGSSR